MAHLKTFTSDFEHPERMCEDLIAGLPADLGPESVAFLSASSQAKYKELMPLLQSRLRCPVVGGTTLSDPFAPHGGDVGASLAILRRPGMKHAVSLSAPIHELNEKEQMGVLYRDCMDRLGCEAKMIFLIIPVIRHLSAGRYLPHIYELAGDVPVFGGMVSDDFDSDKFAVFAEGAAYSDRMVMVAVGGDIHPVWSVACEVTRLSDFSPTITAAYNNVVYGIDDMSFCEYLRRLGFHDDIKLLADFTLAILITGGVSVHDGVPEITHLAATDPVLGCGIFGSEVTPGCRITLGHLTRDDIVSSTRACLDNLLDGMRREREKGRDFGFVFCISCLGRYFALMGSPENVEADMIARTLPDGLPLFGYYGFNEVCPTRHKTGEILNRAHSDSIIMCAL